MKKDNKAAHGRTVSPGKWSDFVEMRKFFNGPTTCSKSLPCLSCKPIEKSSTKLSLGWQLAKQPKPRLEGGFDECSDITSSATSKRNKTHRQRCEHEQRRNERRRKAAQREPEPPVLPKVLLMDACDYSAILSGMPARREVKSDSRWRQHQQQQQLQQYQQQLQQQQQQQPEQQQQLKPEQQQQQQQQQTQQQLQQLQQLWKGDQRFSKWGQKIAEQAHRSHEVPLCERPTVIMCHNQHAAQQYHDQLQYQHQLEQQDLYQQQVYQNHYAQYYGYLQHARQQPMEYAEYSVPAETVYARSQKGRRYVGNYYFR